MATINGGRGDEASAAARQRLLSAASTELDAVDGGNNNSSQRVKFGDDDSSAGYRSLRDKIREIDKKQAAKKAARTTIKFTQRVLQFSWLPLITDKVMNNVRSRALLLLVYMLLASLVAAVAVLANYMPEPQRWTLDFTVPPLSTFELGVPMPPIAVQLRDRSNRGLPGEPVALSMIPISGVDVNVSTIAGMVHSHTVRCITELMLASADTQTAALCNPNYGNQLLNAVATTNSDGMATFTNVTLTFGAPVNYLMFIVALNANSGSGSSSGGPRVAAENAYLTRYISGRALVLEQDIRPVNGSTTWQDLASDFDIVLETDTADAYLLEASAVIVCKTGAPVTAAAALVPIQLHETGAGGFSKVPQIVPYLAPSDDFGSTAVAFDGFEGGMATAGPSSSSIEHVGPSTYRVRFTFSFRIIGCNAPEIFLGMFFFGRTIPVVVTPFSSPNQGPLDMLLPFSIVSTTVVAVSVTSMVSDAKPSDGAIVEGAAMKLVVRVVGKDGSPVSDQAVYIRSRPSASALNPPLSSSSPLLHPGTNPKSLLLNAAMTDINGVATFEYLRFSTSGAVGAYELRVSCQGVAATWSAAQAAGALPPSTLIDGDSRIATVHVTSSVASVDLISGVEGGATAETVGEQWLTVPTLIVSRRATAEEGGISYVQLPGKVATIVPLNSAEVGLSVTAVISGDDGVIRFDSVVATFARFSGAHHFAIVVDGLKVANFSRTLLLQPKSDASCACIAVTGVVQSVFYTGLNGKVEFRALNSSGQPSPFASVTLLLPDPFATPLLSAGGGAKRDVSSTAIVLQTDSAGIFSIPFGSTGVSQSTFVAIVARCSDPSLATSTATQGSHLVVIYRPRLRGIANPTISLFPASTIFYILFTPVSSSWDVINTSAPVSCTVAAVWGPRTMDLFGDGPRTSAINITASGPASIVLANMQLYFVGLYAMLIVVENAPMRPQVVLGQSSAVANITLIQPSNWASQLRPGQQFSSPARLLLRDAKGNPVAGGRLSAQLGVVSASNTSVVEWLSPSVDPSNFTVGAVGLIGSAAVTAMHTNLPVSGESDASGSIVFASLGLIAAQPGVTFALRYCAYHNMQFSILDPAVSELCVEDLGRAAVQLLDATHCSVSPSTIVAVPGQDLPPLTVSCTNGLIAGSPVPSVMCTYAQLGAPPIYLRKAVSTQHQAFTTLRNDRVFSNPLNGTLVIAQSFYFDVTTPDAVYGVSFRCTGATTLPVWVSTSRTVQSLTILQAPPATVALNRYFAFTVQALSASNIPVQGVAIEILQTATDKNCQFSACGDFSATSTTFEKTNAAGVATFVLGYESAATSSYVITAQLTTASSAVAIKQSVDNDLTDVKWALGVPQDGLKLAVASYSGGVLAKSLADIQGIVDAISDDSGGYGIGITSSTEALQSVTFEEYIKSIAARVLSHASQRSADSLSSVSVSATVNVSNPVKNITVLRNPLFSVRLSKSLINDIVGAFSYIPSADELPVVAVVVPMGTVSASSSSSLPAPPLDVELLPTSLGGRVELTGVDLLQTVPNLINATITFVCRLQLRVTLTAVGQYSLWVSSHGNAAVVTAPFDAVAGAILGSMDTLKAMSVVVLVVFSPLLQSSVPHSRSGFLVVASLSTAGLMAAIGVFVYYELPKDLAVVFEGFMWFVVVVTCITTLLTFGLAVLVIITRNCWPSSKFRVARVGGLSRRALQRAKHLREVEARESPKIAAVKNVFRRVARSLADFEDTEKAEQCFTYTHWLINVRVDEQALVPPKPLSRVDKIAAWMDNVHFRVLAKVDDQIAKVNAQLEENVVPTALDHQAPKPELFTRLVGSDGMSARGSPLSPSQGSGEHVWRVRRRRPASVQSLPRSDSQHGSGSDSQLASESFSPSFSGSTPAPLARRALNYDDAPNDAVYLPVNFLIVLAITAVLIALITFFMYYIYTLGLAWLGKLQRSLPVISDPVAAKVANDAFIAAVSQAIALLVSAAPTFGFLAGWIGNLQHVDVIWSLAELHRFVTEVMQLMKVCFIIGVVFATLAVLVTAGLMVYQIPGYIRQVRRGTDPRVTKRFPRSNAAVQIEGYIGIHCVLFLFLHQLTFWPVAILALVIGAPVIRWFLYDRLKFVVLTAVGSFALQKCLQVFLVGWFLSDDTHIIRPELYSMLSIFGLVLGVFTGLAKAATRWAEAVVAMCILFGRIDHQIFPRVFAWLDPATSCFNSLIAMEAANGNPHALCFSAWLIAEAELRRVARDEKDRAAKEQVAKHDYGAVAPSNDENASSSDGGLVIDVLQFAHSDKCRVRNGGMRNLVSLCIQHMVAVEADAADTESQTAILCDYASGSHSRSRRELVRNRFWLLLLLHRNASLRAHRKHALFDEVVTAEAPREPPS